LEEATTLRSKLQARNDLGNGLVADIPGRFVEEGILRIPERVGFDLRFQSFPSWILALDRLVVKYVTFVDWSTLGALIKWVTDQGHSATMLNASIAHIGLGKVRYGKSFDSDAIWLISGSLDFIVSHNWSIKNATLCEANQATSGSNLVETLPRHFWRQHPLHGLGGDKYCNLQTAPHPVATEHWACP
jgi:hypothetical protein